MTKLVEMSGIRKTYDGKRFVLDNLDFSIDKGEIASIFGASGCGKSTMLNIVGMLDSFTDGKYLFNGSEIKKNKLNQYYKQRATDIGFVFQAYCLIDSLSVKDNILMPFMYNNRYIDKKISEKMDSILEDFNMLHLKNKKTALLSGGEKQRTAIARAMIKDPKLIIADEPTGNLDESNADLVVKAFNKIAAQGTSVIVVTHNRNLSFETGTAYFLEGGAMRKC